MRKALVQERPAAPSESLASNNTDSQLAEVTVTPTGGAGYLGNPAPVYPSDSVSLGEVGRVVARVLTREDGSVEAIVLQRSSGFTRLDEAALQSVRTWRFEPGPRWVLIPIRFSLG
ncbi:energy transducer TonB [Comamonas serinivorans]